LVISYSSVMSSILSVGFIYNFADVWFTFYNFVEDNILQV
jgi:hypothetical protein